ncbi:MAG: 4Fe-4S dicluster domain-containing protein [Pyrobaculum sp.]
MTTLGFSQYAGEALAEARRCVFCGFCESVCPTYLAERDRRYGPRGRLQLSTYVLNGAKGAVLYDSFFTCLNCRACELICPAGIKIVNVIKVARAILSRYL